MIETKFSVSGATVNINKLDMGTFLDKLPNKVYTVKHNKNVDKYYLGLVQDNYKASLPKKIYGVQGRQDKVVKTFKERQKSTGVLLTGDSGVGKTQLMLSIAEELRDEGYPVVLVESDFHGENFNEFINSLGVCVVLFDEFGKVYGEKQESLLSLLDGTVSQKKLFIFTENQSWSIDNYILNRPGRAYYHFKYTKLEIGVVNEYLSEVGITTENKTGLLEYYSRVNKFSFDTLKTIVSECNRFPDTSIEEILEELNIPAVHKNEVEYKVIKLLKNNIDITNDTVQLNYDRGEVEVAVRNSDRTVHINFTQKKELINGTVVYKTKILNDIYEVTLIKDTVNLWAY